MTTKVDLENSLREAMRSGDAVRKRTLRMALSAIRLAEVEKRVALDEPAVLAILQKEIKSRRESISDAEQAGRPDIAAEAETEISILEGYLPQPLSPAELEAMARAAIDEVGATSPREMGQVMKILMPRIQGRADGALASQIVRQLLG
ncbi:MAG TPA: GatB/YqeY domain-containing protein [Anaerolineales bacterium]